MVVRAGMFDNLSQRLEGVWDTVRKDGKLTADNIKTPMREIRRALLEADVSHLQTPPGILLCTATGAGHLHASVMCHACQLPDVHACMRGCLLADRKRHSDGSHSQKVISRVQL